MFCPRCGKHIERDGVKFCTECGYQLPFIPASQSTTPDGQSDTYTEHQESIRIGDSYTNQSSIDEWSERNNVSGYAASRPYYSTPKKKESRKKTGAILVAILMILTAAVVVIIDNESNNTKSGGSSTTVTGQSIDDFEVSYSGAFTSGIFTYEETTHDMDSDGDLEDCLVITLSDSYASEYSYFVWTVYDESSTSYIAYVYTSDGWTQYMYYNSSYTYTFSAYDGSTVAKSEACLYWSGYIAGDYTISVTCYESESDYENSTNSASSSGTTYSGELRLDGDIITDYEWTYDGNTYTIEISYTYAEFEYYHELETTRDSSGSEGSGNVVNFVEINDTISEIAEKLQELYAEEYGSDASLTGQSFANFILAFVQCCYYYPAFSSNSASDLCYADYVVYGEEEYFAYPMETIYYGMGDCEDTSILAAAIYEACGYDAAIGLLPGHAIVGVALDEYDTPTYTSSTYEILYQNVDGKTYYGGETTVDSFQSLGVIRYYEYDEHTHQYTMFSEYIGKGSYRFYEIDS